MRPVLNELLPSTCFFAFLSFCLFVLNIVTLALCIFVVCISFAGEAESALRLVFRRASQRSPCIVLIDDMEQLCPARGGQDTSSRSSDAQYRLVSCLLNILDGGTPLSRGVFVVATSSYPHKIDAALRRPGRLDMEVELAVPSPLDREQILMCILRSFAVRITESQEPPTPAALSSSSSSGAAALNTLHVSAACVQRAAAASHGMVASDLLLVCKQAITDIARHSSFSTPSTSSSMDEFLQAAVHSVVPSAIREVAVDVPSVRWSDIGGMESVKTQIKEVRKELKYTLI